MKTKPQLISFILIYAFTAAMTFAQTPVLLPSQDKPFSDAKIGTTYKDSTPGSMKITKAPWITARR
jgi:hypothetical protein